MGILDIKENLGNKELDTEKYAWGLKHFQEGVNNNWTVAEISMQDDAEQWNVPEKLSKEEHHLVLNNLKFFAISEAMTQDSIALVMMKNVQDGYVRMALTRQAYEEALHSQTFLTIAESLSLPVQDVYQDYKTTKSIKDKIDFINSLLGNVDDRDFDITTIKGKQTLLRVAFAFFQILEGTFFFTNFAMLFSLRRKNKMKGLASFIDYIARDESVHISIGRDLIRTIIKEYPEVWTEDFQIEICQLFQRAVMLEDSYIEDSIDPKLIGLSQDDFKEYIRYIANRRMDSFGLAPKYFFYDTKNPFPWMSVETDLITESNFFETRSKEYATGKVNMDF